MLRTWMCGCVALALFAPAVRAQPAAPAKPADRRAMYEDIEVMRRILNQQIAAARGHAFHRLGLSLLATNACTSCHTTTSHVDLGVPAAVPADPAKPNDAASHAANRGLAWLAVQQRHPTAPSTDSYFLSKMHAIDAGSNTLLLDRSASMSLRPHRPAVEFEGAYLKGHGVVFTATVPAAEAGLLEAPQRSPALAATCGKCHEPSAVHKHAAPAAPAARPVSLWDRTRREVRGEPEPSAPAHPAPQAQEVCAPGNLAERVLATLAEHGHNFRQLAADESLSVVVTVPADPAPSTPDKGPAAAEQPASLRTARQLLDLAELHQKQGKADEALKTLNDVIKRLTEQPLDFARETPYETARQQIEEVQQLLRSACTRAGQLLLNAGKVAEARSVLEKASVKVEVKPDLRREGAPSTPKLPAKLVVTVPRKALDQVHAGQIDAEQFRKAAEVEAVHFAQKKKD